MNMENNSSNQIFASKPEQGQSWDVAIIGSGPAAFTAAIYTVRGAASTVILGGEKWGGQLMLTTAVDNYPGLKGIQGPELMQKMKDHAVSFGSEFVQKTVESVDFSKTPFELQVAGGEKYLAKAIIISTGAETKWLGVSGEEKLLGRGVSSCAPCDAPFFKQKKVVVIGGGDTAMEEALVLTKYASSVTIIHRRSELRASKAMQTKVFELEKQGKVGLVWDSEVVEFLGDQALEKAKIKNVKTGKTSEIVADGAFVAIGHVPMSKIFKGRVQLDEKGYVVKKEGSTTATNIPGVFVAGDIHDYRYKQAVTAAGFGAMAGLDCIKFIDELSDSS